MHDKDDHQSHNAEQQQTAPKQPRKEDHRSTPPQRFGKGVKKREVKGGGFNWKRVPRTAGIWIFIILIAVVVSQNLPWGGASDGKRVTYTEYLKLLENGRIKRATIVDTNFRGELTEPLTDERTGRHYAYIAVNLGIVDSEMIALWQKYGVEFSFEDKSTSWIGYFVSSLPWLFFLGMWLFLLRQMQGGPKGVFSFGKSRARLLTEDKPKVTFKDVAGAEEAKQELQEIIEFLKDPKKFQRLGGRIPKGVLLVGPPGTGKTYMAKAVAGEAGVPFFSMSGSDFVEMFVGVGASRVRDLFEQGKSSAPCIIFIDELDAVGRHRGAGIGGGHDEREQTLNQLLVEMDGFESNEGVIMIAATNRPDVLDPALLRPGRFDRMVVVDRPDVKGREGILNVHVRLKSIPLSRDVDLGVLARGTPGLSGADIENLINEAALLASRYNRKFVMMEDFENAKDKVMMGTERRSLVISDQEKRLIAYHEIGHALVAKLTPGSDPVHKVMIIPRGRALGLTHLLPIDERRIYQKSYLVGTLSYILGGRCAEQLVFGEVANGAADDLERVTVLARNMVCEWGMSERLGALTYGKKEEEIFLGREITQHRDYSERTAELIDEEVKVLIESAERRADQILRENIEKLHALAHVLLELEVLDGAQIDRILAGEKVGKAFTTVSSSDTRSRSIQSDGRSLRRSRRRRRSVKTQQEDTKVQAQDAQVSSTEKETGESPSDAQHLDEKKTPEKVVS